MPAPRSSPAADALIIGAGIAGMACAEELVRRGLTVRIFDRRAPGGEASWAAGGMLAADYEPEGPGPLADLAAASRSLWPEMAERLSSVWGHDVGLRQTGTLVVASDEASLDRLRARLSWLTGARRVEWLDPRSARRLEPALVQSIAGAALLPDDGIVNNRAVLLAQVAALRAQGVEIAAGAETALWIEGGELKGVTANGEKIAGGVVVNAAGAWAGAVGGQELPRFVPVRGQMLQVPRPAGALGRAVRWASGYAVPRREHVVVGSTSEPGSGFESRVTPEGQAQILGGLAAALPALAVVPSHAWAGLRPASADGLPVLGRSRPFANLFYAAGLFRNGILLTPAAARAVADQVEGKSPPFPIAAFYAGRDSVVNAAAILLNGTSRPILGDTTVASLLAELSLLRQGVAVALNEEVVRRGDWGTTALHDRDRVEIIHAVGGG